VQEREVPAPEPSIPRQPGVDEIRDRLQHVLDEYLMLDAILREIQSTRFRVCIFGSARIQPSDQTYKLVRKLARQLAMDGIDIVTGGGPGLMEAANRGVREARTGLSMSYGVTIELPSLAEMANKHLDIKSSHKRFSSRLDEFMRLTHAVVVAPGGIGTLLELMYVWQLLQVGLIEKRPVVLLGQKLWGGLVEWIRREMLPCGFISPEDLEHVTVVDTLEETLALVRDAHKAFNEEHADTAAAALREGGQPGPPPVPTPGGAPPAGPARGRRRPLPPARTPSTSEQ
jgi:uncharacterized protein (TIGR00730 family)